MELNMGIVQKSFGIIRIEIKGRGIVKVGCEEKLFF